MDKDDTDMRSLSERVYDLIRRDILLGQLMPEEKLQLEGMAERYAIGAVPVREALNRLSAEGLVERKSQRGFFVAPLALDDLEELVKTRIWLETKALAESIAHGDEAWEEGLVLAFHRLTRTTRLSAPASTLSPSEEWDIRHRDFHMALISACGSRWLLDFCDTMMAQAMRYRNVSMNIHTNQARREGAPAEHQAILDAALARDVERATSLLAEHYRATLSSLQPFSSAKSA